MSARLMMTVAGKTLPLTFDAQTHAGPLLSSATTAWAGLPFELHRVGGAENVGEVGPPDGEYGLFVMMEGSAEFVVREPAERHLGHAGHAGSQDQRQETRQENRQEIRFEAKPGSAFFFHGTLVHGSPPNMSPWDRQIIYVTYNSVQNAITRYKRPAYIAHRDFTPLDAWEDDCVTRAARRKAAAE